MEVIEQKSKKCEEHGTQDLMLFCIQDEKMICIKCIQHHSGHKVLDFEDTAKSLVVPKLESLAGSLDDINEKSKAMEAFIVEKQEQKQKKLKDDLQRLGELSQKLQDLVRKKFQRLIEARIEEEKKHFQMLNLELLSSSKESMQEQIKQIQQLIDEQLKLAVNGQYQELIETHFQKKQEQAMINQDFHSMKRAINEDFNQSCSSLSKLFEYNQEKIFSRFEDLMNSIIKQPIKSMPELFFIEEKKNIFQYYDFEQNMVVKSRVQFHKQIPLFCGIGTVQGRIFTFGGKDSQLREITNDTYEILYNDENNLNLQRRNGMLKSVSRCVVSQVDRSYMNQDPFLVIIGGSDAGNQATDFCELYCPERDQFYYFPPLNQARENCSCCLFETAEQQLYIYAFSGFNKESVKTVERILIEFDPEIGSKYPKVKNKWELLLDAFMEPSVECCGTFQLNTDEIMVYGGFQKDDEELTQISLFNTRDRTFQLVQSDLKESDCFLLPPVLKKKALIEENEINAEERKENQDRVQGIKDSRLYAWSIFGHVHILDFDTLEWSLFKKEDLDQPQQYLKMHLKEDPQS